DGRVPRGHLVHLHGRVRYRRDHRLAPRGRRTGRAPASRVNASTRTLVIDGPVGPIDVALDLPAGPATGVAVIAHPHPLYAGTRDNKVVQTVARALRATGHACWRPNFRGV